MERDNDYARRMDVDCYRDRGMGHVGAISGVRLHDPRTIDWVRRLARNHALVRPARIRWRFVPLLPSGWSAATKELWLVPRTLGSRGRMLGGLEGHLKRGALASLQIGNARCGVLAVVCWRRRPPRRMIAREGAREARLRVATLLPHAPMN